MPIRRVAPITCVILTATMLARGTSGAVVLSTLSYSQDFDSLPSSGANPLPWVNNGTLPGWYARRAGADQTVIRQDDGSLNNGSLYSYGAAGATERALGSISSGTTLTQNWGVAFVNNTGATISSVTLSYTGEQWREGGGATLPPPNVLDLGYKIVTNAAFSSAVLDDADFTDLTGNFDFASVAPAQAVATALDGNAPANRQPGRGGTITGLNWAVGEVLVLRWRDVDDFAPDDGLAIDDFSLSVAPAPGAPLAYMPANWNCHNVGGPTPCEWSNGYGSKDMSVISADGQFIAGPIHTGSVGAFEHEHRYIARIDVATHEYLPLTTPISQSDPKALAMSRDGGVIVGVRQLSKGAPFQPFRWTAQTGPQTVPPPAPWHGHPPEDTSTAPRAVSDDGQTIFGETDGPNGDSGAWRWTEAEGLVELARGPYSGARPRVSAASPDGQVAVGWTEDAQYIPEVGRRTLACRWNGPDNCVLLPPPAPFATWEEAGIDLVIATAMTPDARVIVGSYYRRPPFQPGAEHWGLIRWVEGVGAELLPRLAQHPTNRSLFPWGVSDDGMVIVGDEFFTRRRGTDFEGSVGAIIWTHGAGTMPLSDYLARHGGLPYMQPNTALNMSADGSAVVGAVRYWGPTFPYPGGAYGQVNGAVITGITHCRGDSNGDFTVNFADLNAVLSQFGAFGFGFEGDVTADARVNFSDLNLVLSHFGENC